MGRFRISEGYGKHRQGGVSYEPGAELELDRYDPKWGDKFEPRDQDGTDLKRVALVLQRKVWAKDLKAAMAEAETVERNAARASAIALAAQPDEIVEEPAKPAASPPPPPPPRRGPGRPPLTPRA